jgi:hypothetical protein
MENRINGIKPRKKMVEAGFNILTGQTLLSDAAQLNSTANL